MKITNTIWLFILIFLMVLGIFLFLNKSASKTPKNLEQTLACYDSEKLDQTILALPQETQTLRAFISFQSLPLSEELEQELKNLEISLDYNSVVFDYIWATIPVNSICQLTDLSAVKSIFTSGQK
ncbi:hypothetical protein H6761_02040 [Candidatus Nomurabacteria bacterium]|nr:hypothetical protein [Candidatus Nomurabacteria bacterium]